MKSVLPGEEVGQIGKEDKKLNDPLSCSLGPWLVICLACTVLAHLASVGGCLDLLGDLLVMVGLTKSSSLPTAFFYTLIFVFTNE